MGLTLQSGIAFFSLGFAALFVLVRAAVIGALDLAILGERMGPVTWDFSKSWASTFTVVGAVLASILSAKGVVPDKPHFLPAGSYAALNLLFTVTVVLAGFMYRATSVATNVGTAPGGKEVQYQGFVWSFLVASVLTLWAVVGEVATIFLLFGEMTSQPTFGEPVLWLFLALMVAAGLLLLLYVWRGLEWTIKYQRDTALHTLNMTAALKAANASPAPGSVPPLPPVPLL